MCFEGTNLFGFFTRVNTDLECTRYLLGIKMEVL